MLNLVYKQLAIYLNFKISYSNNVYFEYKLTIINSNKYLIYFN